MDESIPCGRITLASPMNERDDCLVAGFSDAFDLLVHDSAAFDSVARGKIAHSLHGGTSLLRNRWLHRSSMPCRFSIRADADRRKVVGTYFEAPS
jgi:hypothetical protein